MSSRPTIEAVMRAVAAAANLPPCDLRAETLDPDTTRARQLAMYLARRLTGRSYQVVGRAFDRHWSTVMHAFRVTEGRLAGDRRYRLVCGRALRSIESEKRCRLAFRKLRTVAAAPGGDTSWR